MQTFATYEALSRDQSSRLRQFRRAPHINAYLRIALARPYLEAVEVLLDPGNVSPILADIRLYILAPMLWEGNRLCGIRHRAKETPSVFPSSSALQRGAGYLYGARHTGDIPHRHLHMTKYYSMGLLHRADGPALIDLNCFIYYQHGRRARESGPTYLTPGLMSFPVGSPIRGMDHMGHSARISLRRGFSLENYNNVVTIRITSESKMHRINIVGCRIAISSSLRHTEFEHPAFRDIYAALRQYIRSIDVRAFCDYEWERAAREV